MTCIPETVLRNAEFSAHIDALRRRCFRVKVEEIRYQVLCEVMDSLEGNTEALDTVNELFYERA
jgi:hypothetical protein